MKKINVGWSDDLYSIDLKKIRSNKRGAKIVWIMNIVLFAALISPFIISYLQYKF